MTKIYHGGIKLSTGKISEASIIKTSSEYIKTQITPASGAFQLDASQTNAFQTTPLLELLDTSTVHLPKIILEPADFFDIKIIALTHTDSSPTPIVLGKIAGQKEMLFKDRTEELGKQSIWKIAFGGNILTILLRSVGYILGTIFFYFTILPIKKILAHFKNR